MKIDSREKSSLLGLGNFRIDGIWESISIWTYDCKFVFLIIVILARIKRIWKCEKKDEWKEKRFLFNIWSDFVLYKLWQKQVILWDSIKSLNSAKTFKCFLEGFQLLVNLPSLHDAELWRMFVYAQLCYGKWNSTSWIIWCRN